MGGGAGGGEGGACCLVKMTSPLPKDLDEDENANKAWRETRNKIDNKTKLLSRMEEPSALTTPRKKTMASTNNVDQLGSSFQSFR